MSQYFQAGDIILWNPSNRVAKLFVRGSEAVAPLVTVPSGLGGEQADEYELDLDAFVAFVDALVEQYLSSSHLVLRSMMEGFLATAIVLVDRAGRDVRRPATEPAPRDVSVGPGGIGALGDAARLRELADWLAPHMPR